MKYRMNIAVMVTGLVILACLVWAGVSRQKSREIAVTSVIIPQPAAIDALMLSSPQTASAELPAALTQTPAEIPKVAGVAAKTHIAQPGETVTSLAADLRDKDSQAYRDAIIKANSSLKADPDKLIAGKAYRIPSAAEVPVSSAASPLAQPAEVVKPKTEPREVIRPEPTKDLKYTARSGDTVSTLAGAFLGSEDKAHQDKIVDANASLRADPDKLVAGKAYHIPAPNGLSASTTSAVAGTAARPTTQPDADQVISEGAPRTLRYTAHAGDTVTSLAIELLGSDTQETRDAIINNNPDLKRDPNRVIAGQTYWIPAPVASIQMP